MKGKKKYELILRNFGVEYFFCIAACSLAAGSIPGSDVMKARALGRG